MKKEATVRLMFPSETQVDVAFNSLQPETKKPTTTRSKVSLSKEHEWLVLKVEAKDTVALRATLNAYLRWIDSTLNVLKVLEAQRSLHKNE